METAGEPAWAALKDEELLALRICDLGVRIEGSELEPRIRQFHDDLAARGVPLRPPCYLGDEWFCPAGSPAIAIPFYLAHPRLKALELRQMLEVEGGAAESCHMLLRHECGHALDHAYRFSSRPDWQSVFGSPEAEYTPETYTPRPYSRGFVRHLPNWYAQAHPDEDFAETFAVWLSAPPEEWRSRYHGWKALEKLEYVHALMQEASAANNRQMVGKTVEVLVEGPSKLVSRRESAAAGGVELGWEKRRPENIATQMVGRTRGDQVVVFDGNASQKGRLIDLLITRSQSLTLFGEAGGGEGRTQNAEGGIRDLRCTPLQLTTDTVPTTLIGDE